MNEVALAGLDHCMVCTAAQDKVYVRHYHIGFQRSGSKVRQKSNRGQICTFSFIFAFSFFFFFCCLLLCVFFLLLSSFFLVFGAGEGEPGGL